MNKNNFNNYLRLIVCNLVCTEYIAHKMAQKCNIIVIYVPQLQLILYKHNRHSSVANVFCA